MQKVKGTQDFLDMRLYNFIIGAIKKHLSQYHFHEIMTPLVEPLDLFVRSLGNETDVVTKEMFVIDTQEHREKICLRPEGTAPVVRAFIEHGNLQVPWKVFSAGPMFRYERPQRGRYRQFHQVTVEVIGSVSVCEDVRLITMFDRLFTNIFLLDNYALTINFLGCFADREQFKKMLYSFLSDKVDQLCSTCLVRKEKNILRIFDCKNSSCQALYKDAPHIADHLCQECSAEWSAVQDQLHLLSVSFTVLPTLVRGLDYYDKTVFEFVSDNLGAQNAFCSGGRYDGLVKELGGADQPCVGAAIGVERLLLMLEKQQDKLPLPVTPALIVVLPLAAEQRALALLLADELSAGQLQVDVLFQDSLKSMMRKANNMGATYCVLVGSQEQQEGAATVKNMVTGHEERVSQAELVTYFKK